MENKEEAKNVITSIRINERQYIFLRQQKIDKRKSLNSLILDAIDLLIEKHKKDES